MKAILITIAITLTMGCYSNEVDYTNGANIEFQDLDSETISKLELIGKVWGFMKYHHPKIAEGNYNWDHELFKILPKYLKTTNTKERDSVLIDWIESFGKLEECKDCKPTSKKSFLKPDHKWIENQKDELKNSLREIYQNRHQGDQYYVKQLGVGNPSFTNESTMFNMPFPDKGYRLLALFRYWNIINFYFPYKHLIEKEWSNILKEYIPIFLNTNNELEYEKAFLLIINDIHDTHANLWVGADKVAKWKGEKYAAVHVRFIENKLVVDDYYNHELKDEVGLKIGDVITHINGKTIESIISDKINYYPASNYPTKLRNISRKILCSSSSELKIKYNSGNSKKILSKILKMYPKDSLDFYYSYPDIKGKSFKFLKNNIGYITLQNIQRDDIKKIKEEFFDTKGIIIDIRNYPSTFVPYRLGSFIVSNTQPFAKFTHYNINNPGEFSIKSSVNVTNKGRTYNGKLIILVNELSQSQAEFTTMAFQAGDNTTVIGSTTAGADGNVSYILLPGGLRTMISGIGVYYPDGKETQRVGIIPDIEVKPTIEGIRSGKDEVLEKAIKFINSN